MVKIRLQGLPEEVQKSVKMLESAFRILYISREYKNRNSKFVRVYLTADFR